MFVTIETDQKYAPCSYLLCQVADQNAIADIYDDDNTILYQTDWDFPGLARLLGAEIEDTDDPSEEIRQATDWLDEHESEVFEIDGDCLEFGI